MNDKKNCGHLLEGQHQVATGAPAHTPSHLQLAADCNWLFPVDKYAFEHMSTLLLTCNGYHSVLYCKLIALNKKQTVEARCACNVRIDLNSSLRIRAHREFFLLLITFREIQRHRNFNFSFINFFSYVNFINKNKIYAIFL